MALSMREQLREASGAYLPTLLCVFYTIFDPVAGPTIIHQVPEGSIATRLSTFPSKDNGTSPAPAKEAAVPLGPSRTQNAIFKAADQERNSTQVLFDFSSILEFVIPKPELCGHLITKATRTSKILGFPVRIVDEDKYHTGSETYNRNTFSFNVCFVFERDAELSGFEPIVRKTGRTLRLLEESSSYLSSPPPSFSMNNLLEQMYMDINNFSESSIRIGDTDLELFLSPFYANPQKINNWDVPIAIAPLESMRRPDWDVTLHKICSFINGINHVRKIAELAEVDLHLARLSVQHLVFYSAVLIVDMFRFSNSYAALPSIADIAQYGEEDDEGVTDLRSECEAYVYNASGDVPPVPFVTLLELYSHLQAGVSIASWMETYAVYSKPIDVRRMVQFGVIKGFLRRVHAYPVWLDHPRIVAPSRQQSRGSRGSQGARSGSAVSMPGQSIDSVTAAGGSMGQPGTSSFFALPTTPSTSNSNDVTPSPSSPSRSRATAINHNNNAPLRRTRSPHVHHSTPEPNGLNQQQQQHQGPSYPASLPLLFDGSHHVDEICVRYGVSLGQLQVVMRELGGAAKTNPSSPTSPPPPTASHDDGGEGERRGSLSTYSYGPRMVVMYV